MSRVQSTVLASCFAQHVGDRSVQQDRVALCRSAHAPDCLLGVVADGAGRDAAGGQAADSVIHAASRNFDQFAPQQDPPAQFLADLAAQAHTVVQLGALTSGLNALSTMAAVLYQPDRVDFCHVGDTRIYHVRQRRLALVSRDDTRAGELIRQTGLDASQVRQLRSASQLTQSLGTPQPPIPNLAGPVVPQPGDDFLILSDGLTRYFHAGEIVLVLAQHDPQTALQTLIDRARQRAAGRGDNATALLMRISAAPATQRPRPA